MANHITFLQRFKRISNYPAKEGSKSFWNVSSLPRR